MRTPPFLGLALVLGLSAFSESASAALKKRSVEVDEKTIDIVAQKLCKAEPIIGTRIPKARKCASPEELARFREEAREIYETFRHRPCVMGTDTDEHARPLTC